MPSVQRPDQLAPSELGTKEYWDRLYANEVANYASNAADTGTVWFDDADAEAKMVQYLAELDDAGQLHARTVLDLGCGNGSLLRAVREGVSGILDVADRLGIEAGDGPAAMAQKRPRLLNVDYSAASIALAQATTAAHDEENEKEKEDTPHAPIDYAVWDVLAGRPEDLVAGHVDRSGHPLPAASWDLLLDKGTFDAISLGAATTGQAAEAEASVSSDGNGDGSARRSVQTCYRRQVLRLLRPGGRLLITSCNWTAAELQAWLEGHDDDDEDMDDQLKLVDSVPYPSFQFGGVQGQAVVTLCFAKWSHVKNADSLKKTEQ